MGSLFVVRCSLFVVRCSLCSVVLCCVVVCGVVLGISITLAKMMGITVSAVWVSVSGQSGVSTINTSSVINVVINTGIWVSSIGIGMAYVLRISFGLTFAKVVNVVDTMGVGWGSGIGNWNSSGGISSWGTVDSACNWGSDNIAGVGIWNICLLGVFGCLQLVMLDLSGLNRDSVTTGSLQVSSVMNTHV